MRPGPKRYTLDSSRGRPPLTGKRTETPPSFCLFGLRIQASTLNEWLSGVQLMRPAVPRATAADWLWLPGPARPSLLLWFPCQYLTFGCRDRTKAHPPKQFDACKRQMFAAKPFRNRIHGASCDWLSCLPAAGAAAAISTHVLAFGATHCSVYASRTHTVSSEPPRVLSGRNADSGRCDGRTTKGHGEPSNC
jgi:hypothetical protein